MTDIMSIVSMVLSFLFGGGIVLIVTLKATKRKANAEADSADIDNVNKVIGIWKDTSTHLRSEMDLMQKEMCELLGEISSLRKTIADIRKIADGAMPAPEQIEAIKQTLNNN